MMASIGNPASKIYSEFFGHLDDRRFRASKEQEIRDWLTEGDPNDMAIAQLKSAWGEYDATEIARQH